MRVCSSLVVILGAIALANCEVFFEEKFLDGKRNCCWTFAGDDIEIWESSEKFDFPICIVGIMERGSANSLNFQGEIKDF